ncbi:MAG: tRNA threonylcarbamoyladenosine dehydratase [Clostridia bacterium]|nr:tRNA threonylcarbamoyladenosine dehydratase [Clostridia bacterium]
MNPFSRTALLLGEEAMERLARSRVAVFGVGGVGGYVVEALARSGVGALDLIDSDTVSVTNLNRQIIALRSTVGRYKVDVAAERVGDINPDCRVTVHKTFYLPETQDQFDFTQYDYVVDAIDTVKGKLALVEQARAAGTPIICSMGAGNKLDPAAFEVADIYETSVCPLAKVMRVECRKRGIDHLKVVYSKEPPVTPKGTAEDPAPGKRATPGSIAFVPSAAGLVLAGAVIRDLIGG